MGETIAVDRSGSPPITQIIFSAIGKQKYIFNFLLLKAFDLFLDGAISVASRSFRFIVFTHSHSGGELKGF